MRLHAHADDPKVWLRWLDVLHQHQSRDLHQLPPSLFIHGTEDAIVPVDQVKELAAHHEHVVFEQCAHAPHYHDPERVRQIIGDFYHKVSQ